MDRDAGWLGKFSRRGATFAGAVGIAVASCGPLHAQGYPTKPIRIVVGFSAGGPSDIISRVIGAKVGEILGQQIIVENRTGAGG
jgi:tripartite-type tricarboxylate transporter receptor subunit TctC